MEAANLQRKIRYERDGGVAMMAFGALVALGWIAMAEPGLYLVIGLLPVLVGWRLFALAGVLGEEADRIVEAHASSEPRALGAA